jgi:hypothetical protein
MSGDDDGSTPHRNAPEDICDGLGAVVDGSRYCNNVRAWCSSRCTQASR